MAGLYTISTRAPGTLITALIYNADHQAHVDGRTAAFMQSYATTVNQMNLTEDPFPSGAERLASTFAGEIARIRFEIAAIEQLLSGGVLGTWYDPMVAPGFATIGARVTRTATNTIPTATPTALTFASSTADFNSGVWFSGSPTRFTAPSDGKYYASCSVLWDIGVGVSPTLRRLNIGVNGTFNQAVISNTLIGGLQQRQTVSGVVKLLATDYVQFSAYQDTGADVDIIGDTPTGQSIVGCLVFVGS